jgi:hypothetical protein
MNLKDEGVMGVGFLCLCNHYCTNRMKKKSMVFLYQSSSHEDLS